ncbi:MAG: FeoA family protein [Candidatus Cloacimonadota bacterium]|nr:FeoA family protein [Candidatus Cloacimonadota bacterium]
MFGFGKKRNHNHHCERSQQRKGGGKGKRKHRHHILLSQAEENQKYIVKFNLNKQTIEMGIATGSLIFVHKNDEKENNLVVGIGETRLVIPRKSADEIKVR